MTKAEERALEAYPMRIDSTAYDCDLNEGARDIYQFGYEQAEKDILALIESRLSEIIGDAQPRPALRAELQELIKRIKDQ